MRAPKANAFAERFVRIVRHEVLDLTLVLGERHQDRILRRYAEHYNAQRPHRGLDLRTPDGTSERPISPEVPRVRRIDVLGGLIHEYEAPSIRVPPGPGPAVSCLAVPFSHWLYLTPGAHG